MTDQLSVQSSRPSCFCSGLLLSNRLAKVALRTAARYERTCNHPSLDHANRSRRHRSTALTVSACQCDDCSRSDKAEFLPLPPPPPTSFEAADGGPKANAAEPTKAGIVTAADIKAKEAKVTFSLAVACPRVRHR